MAAYQYEALDAAGKVQKGVLEGDSARQVREVLREKSWLPIDIQAVHEKSTKKTRPPNAYELALLTRQLSILTASGIALEEALQAIARQSTKLSTKSLVHTIRSHVLQGHSLAKSFELAATFPPLYVATIGAGERSGYLDAILAQLADYTENRHILQKKIKTAMIYPSLLALMALVVVIGLMTFVVPKIVAVFEQSEQSLPFITQVVLAISNLLTTWWWLLLLLLVGFVVFAGRFVSSVAGQSWLDGLILKLPLFGKLSRSINSARFASTLAILTQSGVPLVEALNIAAQVVSNSHISRAISQMALKVSEGASMTSQLSTHDYFAPMMVQMIHSGERSGELSSMLARAARLTEDEVSAFISSLLSLLEPIMLVLMGLVIGTIVMAVMLPMIAMNDLVG
ncbi:MAG: type II secretion system inner membrane protein GspF [Moraxella sp.]|nr:type II secretion system inner membrane protein GspF [Moraxella sp.]